MPFYLLVTVHGYADRLRLDCLDTELEDARRMAERIAAKGFWLEGQPAPDAARQLFCAPSLIKGVEVVEEP